MNLTGILPRNSYAVDVLRQGRRMTDVKDGTKMVQFLKELRGLLQQKGYSIQGSVREGFSCSNEQETITIVVEKL
jgi:hypothetical protein